MKHLLSFIMGLGVAIGICCVSGCCNCKCNCCQKGSCDVDKNTCKTGCKCTEGGRCCCGERLGKCKCPNCPCRTK